VSIIEDTKCADVLFALGAQQFIDGLNTRKLNASIDELAATRRQLFGAE